MRSRPIGCQGPGLPTGNSRFVQPNLVARTVRRMSCVLVVSLLLAGWLLLDEGARRRWRRVLGVWGVRSRWWGGRGM